MEKILVTSWLSRETFHQGVSATREYDHLILPHKFSSSEYLLFYAADENNDVGLIHPTKESADTLEGDILYEDMIDTMGYDMLEAMQLKNDRICDNYDSIFGEEHKINHETYSLYD